MREGVGNAAEQHLGDAAPAATADHDHHRVLVVGDALQHLEGSPPSTQADGTRTFSIGRHHSWSSAAISFTVCSSQIGDSSGSTGAGMIEING